MITKSKTIAPLPWDFFSKSFEKQFLKHLKRNARQQNLSAILERATLTHLAGEILRKNAADIDNPLSQAHFLMTSYLLAAYRMLTDNGHDPGKSRDFLQTVFGKIGGFWMKWGTRAGLVLARNKINWLYNTSRRRAAFAYGDAFKIEHRQTGDGFSAIVHRCGYHDFFRRNGAPELTQCMCQWDQNWAAEIIAEKHGVSFTRPQTIATGAPACHFEFKRTPSRNGNGKPP